MAEKTDRRKVMTQKMLKDALIELMKDKPLHQISIKKICETADVNRSTFYNHYETQFALYDDILNDVSRDFAEIIKNAKEKGGNIQTILTEIFCYAENHRELFLVILGNNSNLNLGERFTDNVARFLDDNGRSVLYAYCTQFIAAGTANILWIWLNEENHRSARDVALILNALMVHGVKKAALLAGNGIPPALLK